MGLIIDTCVFIDAEQNRSGTPDFSALQKSGEGYLAAITASELLVGVSLAPDESTRIRRAVFVERVLETIPLIAFGLKEARTYAELCAHFLQPKALKKSVGAHDLLIAATALTHGHSVLTSNKKDFEKIPGLTVEVI